MKTEAVRDHNIDEAAQILVQAFHDDPVMNWVCNHPPALDLFFNITLPLFIPHGLTYMDAQKQGAAAWLGPGQKVDWPITLSNVLKVFKLGGLKGVYRMLKSGDITDKHHPKVPHYYLFAIGVKPEHKGLGIGTRLISQMLKTCDQEGVPAYLENSKEQNLPFYEGHGFKVIQKIQFAPSAPPLWLMWREPTQLGEQTSF